MNIFVHWINKNGGEQCKEMPVFVSIRLLMCVLTVERELVTPPLDGLILPGVTRFSLLELAREWKEFRVSERPVTMSEVVEAHKDKRVRTLHLLLHLPLQFTIVILLYSN